MEQINRNEPLPGAPSKPIEPNEAVRPFRRVAASHRPLVKERRLPTPRNGATTAPLQRNGTLTAARNSRMRRAPTLRPPSMQARSGGLLSARGIVVIALVALGLGVFIGASVSRQRQRRREILISVAPLQSLQTENITTGNLLHQLEEMQTAVPNPSGKGYNLVHAGPVAVQALITQAQNLQFCTAQKPSVLPAKQDLERRFAEFSKVPENTEKLRASGQTEQEAEFNLRLEMAKENMLIGRINFKDKDGKDKHLDRIPVNDTDALKYYFANIDRDHPEHQMFYTPETVQAQVIVTASDPNGTKNGHSGLQKITEALAQLNQGGSMNSVAQEFNASSTFISPIGMLPLLHKGDKTELGEVRGLEAAIFNLKPNEQSKPLSFSVPQIKGGPIETWWIIKCISHTPPSLDPFEQVKKECYTGAALLKMKQDAKMAKVRVDTLEKQFTDFRRHTNLTSFRTAYDGIVNQIRTSILEQ